MATGATMVQVAERAGVSIATVSRVLNGDERVGETYQDRVRAAVADLGYRPNRLAASMRRQRTGAIGVVVADIENPHFSAAIRAVERVAFDRGHHLLVCDTDETPEKERAYLETLLDERVQGVILSPAHRESPAVGKLLDAGVPVVAFDREIDDARADAVLADNVRAARGATEHLIGLGHSSIAYVGGRLAVETGVERLDGYRQAMAAAGLAPWTVDGRFRAEGAYECVTELLAGTRPTAIVVANNLMTLGALRALREAEVHVPSDVALVAIDDPPWAPFTAPALTVLVQPVAAMAADAVGMLLDRVDGDRRESRRVVHPFELRVRGSCGAPV